MDKRLHYLLTSGQVQQEEYLDVPEVQLYYFLLHNNYFVPAYLEYVKKGSTEKAIQ
jgi:hypothetical protein